MLNYKAVKLLMTKPDPAGSSAVLTLWLFQLKLGSFSDSLLQSTMLDDLKLYYNICFKLFMTLSWPADSLIYHNICLGLLSSLLLASDNLNAVKLGLGLVYDCRANVPTVIITLHFLNTHPRVS